MEKETRITAPGGYKIEKAEVVDGVAVITFQKKERKLPKSWEEFCEMFPMNAKECYIAFDSEIISFNPETEISERNNVLDRSVLPDRATAEAVLALCQLIQLRNAYNGNWVPNWKNHADKFVIEFFNGEIVCCVRLITSTTPLFFKTKKLCDEFLRNFRPLIEKLRPLYGIF